MNSLIVNYNWNYKTINEIVRLEFAYSSETKSVVEEYKQKIKDWNKLNDDIFSNNIFFDLDKNDKEKINLIFWILNIILFNEKELWDEYLEVIVKLILIFENEYLIEDKKTYLSMIMNFKNNIFYKIENGTLIFDKDNINLNYLSLDIDDARTLIKYFIEINNENNLYPATAKQNYDYSKCPDNLYSILEMLYYCCIIKTEFMTKEIISSLDNYYNKRFYFIMLNNKSYFSEDKKNAYIKNFKKEEWIYEDEFLFIILSKMSNVEFIVFLTLELNTRYKNSDFTLRASIFWKYYDIYKYYKKDFKLETDDLILKELLNYRNLALSRPKTVEELDHYVWFNDAGIVYNSFSESKNFSDIQEQKDLVISNYNKYEKIIYLAEQISGLIKGKGFYYAEIDGVIKKNNPKIEEIINILSDSNELKEVSKTIENFNYKEEFKANLSTNLVLLKSYLIDFMNVNKINEELSKFCQKYQENSSINNLKLSKDSCKDFVIELNECFKLKFNSKDYKYENIFLLCKIDDNFLSILYSFCFGNKYLKEIELFLPYLEKIIDRLLEHEKTEELELIKKNLNLQLRLNKYIILTKKIFLFQNNIFVIKYNIFFQKKKNFMKEFFEKNLFKESKSSYLLILLKTVFFEGYKSHLEAVKHLNFLMDSEYLLNLLMENFEKKQSNLGEEEWRKRENKETAIFYADGVKQNQIILWSLLSICCFSDDFKNDKFETFKKVYNKFFKEKIDYKPLRINELIGNVYVNINYKISLKELNSENTIIMDTFGDIILWFLKGLINSDNSDRFDSLINYKITALEYKEYSKYLNNEFSYDWSTFDEEEIEIKLLILNALIIFKDLNNHNNEQEKEILKYAFVFCNDNLEKESMWIFKNIDIFKKIFPQIQKNLDILNS